MEDKFILIPISEEYFFAKIRDVVAEEIKKHQLNDAANRMLSPEEARKLFNPSVSRITIHRWTKDGKLPAYRIGRRVYYKESEVLEAVKVINKYSRE
jgi:excisionase family DNA binding protein